MRHRRLLVGDRYDQPEQHAIALDMQRDVQAVLGLLNPRYRLALLLREYEGLSCAEIGTILGLSVPAVKSLLFQARDEFRRLYRSSNGDDVYIG